MAMRLNGQIGVGCVVTDCLGQVLLGYRIKTGEQPSWCLPGGHLECGERFEDAAVRETREESGIADFFDVHTIGVCTHTASETANVTAAVWARTTEANPLAHVLEPAIFEKWMWFRPTNLPTSLFPASAAVLALFNGAPAPVGWIIYSAQKSTAEISNEHRTAVAALQSRKT